MVMEARPAPPPPPTIAYLRDVTRIDAVLLSCNRCAAAQPVPWADLGLPDSMPFPAVAKARAWQCQRCEGTDIGAMPDWRSQRPASPGAGTVVQMAADAMQMIAAAETKATRPGQVTRRLGER